MQLKKYKKEFTHSYALGPFPTFELLMARHEEVIEIHVSENFNEIDKLIALCKNKNIPYTVGENAINRISDKENTYAVGVFNKYIHALMQNKPHVVLHNPADMGNLGTILRTLLGFNIKDIAIIEPSADIFNPKVIRASMGAFFKMRIELFKSFEVYMEKYGEKRDIFPFMLGGKKELSISDCPQTACYALVFGNEASGLPEEFSHIGTSIMIPQSRDVDSLNLAVSVAVGSFVFTSVNKDKA